MSVEFLFCFPVLRHRELGEAHLKFESETGNYKIADSVQINLSRLCPLVSLI